MKWTKPYGMREGFLIGGGVLIAGLILELSVGPVVWDAFRWPVNGMVMGGFLMLIAIVHLLGKKVYGFQFIGTYKAAIPVLVYALVLTIVMGLTRQTSPSFSRSNGGEGSMWINNMLSFWPFVLVYAYMAFILGLVVLGRFGRLRHGCGIQDVAFLLNHLGLFLAMTTATLGNADIQRLRMITMKGAPERRAMNQQGIIVEIPFAIELNEFVMETYDNGSPKRFASDIQIMTKERKNFPATVEVNKPVEFDGWKIYQYGYDTQMGAMSNTSIFELVSDPWLPLVYTGIYMMLAGAVCLFVFGNRKSKDRHPSLKS